MTKIFEPQVINPIITGNIDEMLTNRGGLMPTKPFDLAVKPIEEYDGRMRINSTDKFDLSVFIAVANFYLTPGDAQTHRARGAVVLFVDSEIADKMYKAAGFQVPYDEDDETMMSLCGSLCESISNNLKDRLSSSGYANMEVSIPSVYKNSVPEGVEFSKEQDEKQELSFYFLKRKAMVVEWTMAPIPKK